MDAGLNETVVAQHVSFAYTSEAVVLEDVSFAVHRGEFLGVIGANGAGKSTLLRLLLNQLSPRSGHIRILGVEVGKFHDWHRVGYVPQSHPFLNSAFPATVEEILLAAMYPQIGLFRRASRRHREIARDTLRLVGMESAHHTRIGTLSGGQVQRVLIARALVNSPEALILDEPTSGIDPLNTALLYELLASLNRDLGLTILMVTHDTNRAAAFLGRALCIEDATLVELDRNQLAYELQHRHKHPERGAECSNS